jgi:hypothetical protein
LSTLTPLWVPLVSAAVGAGGALVTTLMTQSLTRRRDDVKWEREDAARWLADRRAAYADLLTALQKHWAAITATRGRVPGDAERATIRDLAAAIERPLQAVILIAPADVSLLADTLTAHVRQAGERGVKPRTDAHSEPTVTDGFTALREAMRTDLKVNTADEG